MTAYTDKQYVELFHLLFLTQLGRKVDKKFYALKGGCNLRFFLKSPRYSQDMDLDAKQIPVHRLGDRVNGVLTSQPFAQILKVRGIGIGHINDDKQIQTVQRWKLGLVVPRIEKPLPTKIEFSRRGMHSDVRFEAIDPTIVEAYELQPLMTNHYSRQIAYQQKVQALMDRKELQARDTFDLDLLLASGVKANDLPGKLGNRIGEAKENVFDTSFDMFAGQVLAYLPAEDQAMYEKKAWDAMRLRVIEALEEIES